MSCSIVIQQSHISVYPNHLKAKWKCSSNCRIKCFLTPYCPLKCVHIPLLVYLKQKNGPLLNKRGLVMNECSFISGSPCML